ncbi:HD domain-containing protein [Gammaproteobacteria bacterium]|nr:HD domain-containing protein [Gammaproteobacteria bacterium]
MSNFKTKQEFLSAAESFAKEIHRKNNHRRKYTGEPYEVHLIAVSSHIAAIEGSPEMIAAAWLHDLVEDTDTTVLAIEQKFGSAVANLVSELTDISTEADGNRRARKMIDRSRIAFISSDAKTIKLADLIDNAKSIIEHDQRFAKVFMGEMKLLLPVLNEGHALLYAEAEDLVNSFYETRI